MHPLKKQPYEYEEAPVEVPSPVEILDQLYAKALSECQRATELIAERDAMGKGRAINKVLEIVDTLALALDHSVAPELCSCLESLYVYVQDQLQKANQEFDAAPIADAVKILTTLRGAFAEASSAVKP